MRFRKVSLILLVAVASATFASVEAACPPVPARPYPTLPCVEVQGYTQPDVDDALTSCGTGCNLYFPAGVYDGIQVEIGDFPAGFAMFGDGPCDQADPDCENDGTLIYVRTRRML